MLTFASRLTFENREKSQYVYSVQSKRTFYQVAILPTEVKIVGPGIEETQDRGEYPVDLDEESLAIYAVMQLESSI